MTDRIEAAADSFRRLFESEEEAGLAVLDAEGRIRAASAVLERLCAHGTAPGPGGDPALLFAPASQEAVRRIISVALAARVVQPLKRGSPSLISQLMRRWRCIAGPCVAKRAHCCACLILPRAGAGRRNWKKRRGWKPWAGLPVALPMISIIFWPPSAQQRKPLSRGVRMALRRKICAKSWIVPAVARVWYASF